MIRPARIIMLLAVLTAGLPFTCLAQEPDPLVGQWVLNVSKSTFDPGPGPKGQIRTYTHEGEIEKLTARGIGPDGKPTLVHYAARYDGKDYPIKGSAGGDQISLKRLDAFTTESTEKRNGRPVIVATRTVSADSRTLTVFTRGVRPDGHAMSHHLVFEKKE